MTRAPEDWGELSFGIGAAWTTRAGIRRCGASAIVDDAYDLISPWLTPEIEIVGGGDRMIEWFVRADAAPPWLAVFRASPAALGWLAASPRLAQIRLLVTTAQDQDLAILLASPHLASLEHLILYDGDARTLRAIGSASLDGLGRLVLYERTGVDLSRALEDLLATTRSPITRLHLVGGIVPVDAIVANPALANLRTLFAYGARFRGGELFGELRALEELTVRRCELDEATAIAALRCPRLAKVELSSRDVGDIAAREIASVLGRSALRDLDLRESAITPAGVRAIVDAPGFAALEKVWTPPLDAETHYALATTTHASLAQLIEGARGWFPEPPLPDADAPPSVLTRKVGLVHREALARGRWPEPPAGFQRLFAIVGPSEQYRDKPAALPWSHAVLNAVIRAASKIRRAEALAVEFLHRAQIAARTIIWDTPHTFDHRGVPAILAAVVAPFPVPPLVSSRLWPVAYPALRDLFAPLIELLDLGYWLKDVDAASITLGMLDSLRWPITP